MLFELIFIVIFVFSEFVKGDYFREWMNFILLICFGCVFFILGFLYGCVKVKGWFLLFDVLIVYVYI